MRQQRGGSSRLTMLEAAKHLLMPSKRSNVPPFMVMDVMAAAAMLEAKGAHVVHMEVGQPAAAAPVTALRAAQRRDRNGRDQGELAPCWERPATRRIGAA